MALGIIAQLPSFVLNFLGFYTKKRKDHIESLVAVYHLHFQRQCIIGQGGC